MIKNDKITKTSVCNFIHFCTIKSPILGRFTSAKATVTMRILNAQRCKNVLLIFD